MEEKKLTGYASIDKPWLKYYSEEAINEPLPECTMYEYIGKRNQDNLKRTAINYYGTNMTYSLRCIRSAICGTSPKSKRHIGYIGKLCIIANR